MFLTAHDLARLSGPPAERRRALDRAALAVDPEHARTLSRYEKARASKTRLLALSPRFDADEMAVYEATLAETGARLAVTRRATRARLEREIARAAAALGSPFRGVSLELVSDLPGEGDEAALAAALEALLQAEEGGRAAGPALPRGAAPGRRRAHAPRAFPSCPARPRERRGRSSSRGRSRK